MTHAANKVVGLRLFIRTPGRDMRALTVSGSEPIVIGRDPGCGVELPSPEVSRQHARIDIAADGTWLTDTSANGTLVDGELIAKSSVALADGAQLQIGPYRIQVDRLEPGAIPAPRDTTDTEVRPAGGGTDTGRRAIGTADVPVAVRREIHRRLLDHLDLVKLERSRMNDHLMRAKVRHALQEITGEVAGSLPVGTDVERLIDELGNEALGLGPLEYLLADSTVTEIMVIDPHTIYVERNGRIEQSDLAFTDEESARSILERIVMPLGRRIDESSPMLDARLRDGSRVNAVIRPVAMRGTCITIRKFAETPFTTDDLIRFGTIDARMTRFLLRSVLVRKNILVAGGTGSGKTTLLNVLSSAIPAEERIVTIEDSAELRLEQPHVVGMESRPPNMEGRGEITIRDLVRNAVRMRPDRIVVGEVRGGEALDMLQAMNTGHDGSMTTTHANSPREAVKRIETLALMAGLDLPSRAVREQIATAIHLLVHQTRFSDGSRRVTSISEVVGLDDDGEIQVREIFGFRRTGTDRAGRVLGEFYSTGYLPTYLPDFVTRGLIEEGDEYL